MAEFLNIMRNFLKIMIWCLKIQQVSPVRQRVLTFYFRMKSVSSSVSLHNTRAAETELPSVSHNDLNRRGAFLGILNHPPGIFLEG